MTIHQARCSDRPIRLASSPAIADEMVQQRGFGYDQLLVSDTRTHFTSIGGRRTFKILTAKNACILCACFRRLKHLGCGPQKGGPP